jgi:secretion/DNA translocation related CpaE-like protein
VGVDSGSARSTDRTDRRPVMMVAAGELADEVLRLAAAAGCEPDRVADPDALRQRWTTAPLLLLDVQAAMSSANAGLPRRDAVVIVTAGDAGNLATVGDAGNLATAGGAGNLARAGGAGNLARAGGAGNLARAAPDPEVWRSAVAVGAEHVAVLPAAEAWLVGALADAMESPADPGRVLAVLGGRGGAGASVFAAAVAVAAVESGRATLLVDCDPLGGGLDLALGAEDIDGLRWSGLALGGGRVAAAALHAALPTSRIGHRGGLTVLSCDRDGPGPDGVAVRTVCSAGRRAGETVVCDVPRQPTEAGIAALETADLAVLVVPAEVRACAAAATVAARVLRYGISLQLVVRGPAPGGLTPRDVSRALDIPLLAAMRPQPGLAAALDRGAVPGRSRGPLATAAAQVLGVLDGSGRALGRVA